jgi:DNA-binding winged helix-turn-helix (wHTH) protein/TolB-like protein
MDAPVLSKRVYRFGLFQVDPEGGKLQRQGVPVRLQDQPLRVLFLLLERPGEIVTREELRRSLWPEGTFVEFEGSLNAALKRLRFALGDDADNPTFIETIPRRGYRFIAPVQCDSNADAKVAPSASAPQAQDMAKATHVESPWKHWKWAIGALTLVLLGLVAWSAPRWKPRSAQEPRIVIAVLPFSNEGAGAEFDYLRYAIPNDLATDLTYAHSVSVRPFASTRAMGSELDPQAVGTKLRVTHVVTGGFLRENKKLRVNVELIDVARNQAIWREQITADGQELISLHDQLASQSVHGLLPAMHVDGAALDAIPSPKNERALELLFDSSMIGLDPAPNQLAIKKLEEAVALDPTFARAWSELGWRYYIDYHYGNGGDAAVAKALEAYHRQSQIDPEVPPVSTTIRVEQGDLNGGYDQAAAFLRRHPDVSVAHYSMSYVLRYAGLLDEAGKQCDAALTIDPGFNVYRSCAIPFFMQGDYTRAQAYIALDEHSSVAAWYRTIIALRTGNTAAALAESAAAAHSGLAYTDLVRIYLSHSSEAELSKAAAIVEADPKTALDPEEEFRNAEVLSLSGRGDAALRQLRKAISGNYCSYPAMETDPLLDGIRQRPEYAELRQAGQRCQQNFLAHRGTGEAGR